jgi:hypothetical protein
MVSQALALVLTGAFLLLALVHVYWALGGRIAWLAAIPEVKARPAFVPSPAVTFAVAVALLLCAGLVSATGGLLPIPVAPFLLTPLGFGLALLLLARAVGDFHLVGFFKRVRGTRFARLDSLLYSPLCLLLAIGLFFLVLQRA